MLCDLFYYLKSPNSSKISPHSLFTKFHVLLHISCRLLPHMEKHFFKGGAMNFFIINVFTIVPKSGSLDIVVGRMYRPPFHDVC